MKIGRYANWQSGSALGGLCCRFESGPPSLRVVDDHSRRPDRMAGPSITRFSCGEGEALGYPALSKAPMVLLSVCASSPPFTGGLFVLEWLGGTANYIFCNFVDLGFGA